MVEERIGYRYAKSLFGLAEEKNILEDVHSDISLIREVISDNRDLGLMLQSPIVSLDKKSTVLKSVFSSHYKSELVPLFVELIVKKGREMYLKDISVSFLKLYDEAKGIVRGVLVSAIPMAGNQAQSIQEALEKKTGKTFVIEEEVDPELIGGFTLKIGDDLFDGSIATSLKRLKKNFAQAN